MFFKISSVPVLGVYASSNNFSKCATKNADITEQEDVAVKRALNLISPDVLKAIAKVYDLSSNINDYIFPVPRAVQADNPNSNGDCFEHDELIRFSPKHRCQVYATFRRDPLHIEHASENPKAARGFIVDATYIQDNPKDRYVLTVVAADTTKDPPLTDGLLSGEIDKFSMGCICEAVQCSYTPCQKIATSDFDLCTHLINHKMSTINGELICEKCKGVEFGELSVVGQPAYEGATTQYILQHAASINEITKAKENFNVLSSLVNKQDQYEIARYFQANANGLPDALLRLANKIL